MPNLRKNPDNGAKSAPTPTSGGRFGTFAGVFTPNILTILGIILFLRMGWVVGQAGLWDALLIVALANAISLLTGFSLSAIATNMQVKAGGNYYIISRSLGLEIGGAIGIPLFLSQAISVAFYIIGFTEALLSVEFFTQFNPQIIATFVTVVFVIISYIGADFALKIQFFILAVLIMSLISFFVGGLDLTLDRGFSFFGSLEQVFEDFPVINAKYTGTTTFWVVFAVFFPAVTGIEVGTSLSGDLKNPSRNIPIGTITSIIFTAIIYLAVIVFFAFNSTRSQLLNDNLAMQSIALVPALILAGVWASTLSSALGSVLAAPRTLQAIANDSVVPKWIAGQMGSKTEPRVAVLITGVIAIMVIWAGDLNAVAPIISMFFLNTYGMVNLSASIENLVGNPSYRPRFKIPWYVSFAGGLGCYGAMFLINPIATVGAIVISYGVFFALQQRSIRRTWGDVRSGIWFAIARQALLNLEKQKYSSKNWRPNLLVFTGQPHNREQLVEVTQWLSLGRGIVTFFQLIVGDVVEMGNKGLRESARKHIRGYIDEIGMSAFAEADIVSDFREGARTIVQSHGVGGLEPNTVLMGWSGTESGQIMQLQFTRELVSLHKSVCLLYYDDERGFGERRIIDIWWQGRGGNADLMLLLAHIIQRHHSWRRAKLRLLRVIDSQEGVADVRKHMQTLLDEVRVNAEPIVVVRPNSSTPIATLIQEESLNTDLTLLGLPLSIDGEYESYAKRLNALVNVVGSVLLVRNSEPDDDILTVG